MKVFLTGIVSKLYGHDSNTMTNFNWAVYIILMLLIHFVIKDYKQK